MTISQIISQITLPNKKTKFQNVRFLEHTTGTIAAPLSALFVDRLVIDYVAGLIGSNSWDVGSLIINQNVYIDNRDPDMVSNGGENVHPDPVQHTYNPRDHNYTIVTHGGAMQYHDGNSAAPLSSTFMDWDVIQLFADMLSVSRETLESQLIAEFGWTDER